jgi:hypothetical protein
VRCPRTSSRSPPHRAVARPHPTARPAAPLQSPAPLPPRFAWLGGSR